MSEFFLKVKKYDDAFHRTIVERKRVTEPQLQDFFKEVLFGDIYRIDSVHIERLTNEN